MAGKEHEVQLVTRVKMDLMAHLVSLDQGVIRVTITLRNQSNDHYQVMKVLKERKEFREIPVLKEDLAKLDSGE